MPVNIAITRQISAAWIRQALDATSAPITGTEAIASWGTVLPFDYIANAGPSWPAPEGAAGTEFVEVTAANGVIVQYPRQTKVLDGVTGRPKSGGAGGNAHSIRFTNLEVGATMLAALVALQGTVVQVCIPIGENTTTAQEGALYLTGKYSSAIEYNAGGEEVIAIDIEVSGASTTAAGVDEAAQNAVYAWAPAAIIPLHADSEEAPITPTPLVAADGPAMRAGEIVIK